MKRRYGILLALLVPAVFAGGVAVATSLADAHPGDAESSLPLESIDGVCKAVQKGIALPRSLDESSGVAVGMRDPAVFWSHNDGGNNSHIVGFDRNGRTLATFSVRRRNRDWEAMDVGVCGEDSCLYLADTGDNLERRSALRVFRLSEPVVAGMGEDVTEVEADRFDFTLPNGSRDIEAMYVLPGEQLFFVTKGRNDLVALYRYPGALREGNVVLEEVQSMGTTRSPLEWITGAGATRDGRHVAIRSYVTLYLFEVLEGGGLEMLPEGRIGLAPLEEAQGEALAFGPDGFLYLTSERRNKRSAEMSVMQCELPESGN